MSAHTNEHTAAPHHAMLARIWSALGGTPELLAAVRLQGKGALPSVFATSDLAQASVAAAGLALAEFMQAGGAGLPTVHCDRRLASMWFSSSLRAQGWTPPALWDSVAGDYRSTDGWIRLHTNAPHHRAAALQVLDLDPQRSTREEVAQAVQRWNGTALESAIVANGGCAAEMRSQAQWALHPQGAAVAAEPLVGWQAWDAGARPGQVIDATRPLAGIRVLDLTRVLAGPTATRLLAGFGAEVLRIDPAYRPQALEQLGLGVARRRELNPALVDVSLDAYGWSGPWAGRRGFDSLVQMSSGMAHTGMQRRGADKPVPLPVQALDHATGYLLAAAALRGLTRRQLVGAGSQARLSLARTARLLADYPMPEGSEEAALGGEVAADLDPAVERTVWGPAHRLLAPLQVAGAPLRWDLAASPLRSSPARWKAGN